jgi:hypothetical protein
MTQRTIQVLKGYARCSQLPADILIIGLLGFIAVKDPAANPVAAHDAFQRFLKTARSTDDRGICLLCVWVDTLNDDAGFLRYFEEFTLAHEELLGGNVRDTEMPFPSCG